MSNDLIGRRTIDTTRSHWLWSPTVRKIGGLMHLPPVATTTVGVFPARVGLQIARAGNDALPQKSYGLWGSRSRPLPRRHSHTDYRASLLRISRRRPA